MVLKNNYRFNMNGKSFYGVSYINDSKDINKIVVICHGMAEHIDRYDFFANSLSELGYKVFAYNQRGHKYTSSKEDYGYIGEGNSFNHFVNDLKYFITDLINKYNEPIYLFGHSMGSFISTRYALLYPNTIHGLILSGTGRNPSLVLRIGLFLTYFIKLSKGDQYKSPLIDKITFGSFNKKIPNNKTSLDWLNTKEDEVKKYINDEYCGGLFTINYYRGFFKGLISINKNLKKMSPNLPILLVSGKEDPVGNYGLAVTKIYNILSKKNKHIKLALFDKARHEILLEKDKDLIIKTIINYLDEIKN